MLEQSTLCFLRMLVSLSSSVNFLLLGTYLVCDDWNWYSGVELPESLRGNEWFGGSDDSELWLWIF